MKKIECIILKFRLLHYLRKKSPRHSVRLYFSDKSKRLIFLRVGLLKTEMFVVTPTVFDYATLRGYVADGSFITYKGRQSSVLPMILSMKRYWKKIERTVV